MSLRPQTVCFTGHRDLRGQEKALTPLLDQVIEALYRRGYRRFFSGGAMGFDLLAAERMLHFRETHPDVRLIMAIPCADQTAKWPAAECRRYERVLYHADETRVLAPHYYRGCMMVRNRHMVNRSSVCVCYLDKPKGGTVTTVAYAAAENLSILNLALTDACAAYVKGTMRQYQ